MSVLCDTCYWPMKGIIHSAVRTTCEGCGGHALVTDADRRECEAALVNAKRRGDLPESYKFWYALPVLDARVVITL